jgi:hypothetical protein
MRVPNIFLIAGIFLGSDGDSKTPIAHRMMHPIDPGIGNKIFPQPFKD